MRRGSALRSWSSRERRLLAGAGIVATSGIAVIVLGLGEPDRSEPAAASLSTSTTALAEAASSTTVATTSPPPTVPLPTLPVPIANEPPGSFVPTGVLRTPSGILAPIVADLGGGRYEVQTPCDARATTAGTPLGPIDVVLDPGHGGGEPGAVGPNGLAEKDVNLAIAQQVADQLTTAGIRVVLTRDIDVRLTLAHRANIAVGLGATFLSIHHNAVPDGPSGGPGTEVYFQIADDDSRRLAGLVVEEVRAALAAFPVTWASDAVNGARTRTSSDGTDYYGVLRRTAGFPGVLVESGYISNPPEADLFASPEGQAAEAGAITRAILRYFDGGVAADGAFSPNPAPTGGAGGAGGGLSGCIDPALE